MEKIFSYAWRGKRGLSEGGQDGDKPQDNYVNDEQGLQRRHNVDTFLQVYATVLIHWKRIPTGRYKRVMVYGRNNLRLRSLHYRLSIDQLLCKCLLKISSPRFNR